MVNVSSVTKVEVINYDFTGSLSMSLKGYRLTKEKLNKARIKYPIRLPIQLTLNDDGNHLLKYNKEFKDIINKLDSVKFARDTLASLDDEFDENIKFKYVFYDTNLNKLCAQSSQNVMFGSFPKTYFDDAKFLIPTHLNKILMDLKADKNAFALLKLGDYSLLSFNYYTFSMVIIAFMFSYIYAKYGEPPVNLEKDSSSKLMSYDSYKFFFTLVGAQLGYNRMIPNVVESSYKYLTDTGSLPLVSINKDLKNYEEYSKTFYEGLVQEIRNKQQLNLNLPDNLKDLNDEDDSEDDGVESFFTWDAGDLFELWEYGYLLEDPNQTITVSNYPLWDFIQYFAQNKGKADNLNLGKDEIIILTKQQGLLVGNFVKTFVNENDIIVGFYTEGRLILILSDRLLKKSIYAELSDRFEEDPNFESFSAIELYTESDVRSLQKYC